VEPSHKELRDGEKMRILGRLFLLITYIFISSFYGYCIILRYNVHAGDKWIERQSVILHMESNNASDLRKFRSEILGIITYRIDSVNTDGTFKMNVLSKLISHKSFIDNKQIEGSPDPNPPFTFILSKSGKLIKMQNQMNIGNLGSALARIPIEFAEKNVNIGESWSLSTNSFIDAGLPSSLIKKATGRILSIKSSPENNKKYAEVEACYECFQTIPQNISKEEVQFRILFKTTRLIDTETGIPLEGNTIIETNIPQKTSSGYVQMSMKINIKIEPIADQR
jgi:hypothetical protein